MTLSNQVEAITFSALERKSFRAIFDTLFRPLCAFASKYIKEDLEAEDLVQDAFVALWEQRENFENFLSAKSFLYTSTRNKCLNVLKHRTVIQKHEEALIYELESDHFFSNQVIAEESFNLLYREIENFPDASKKIMLLALQGSKNREIADQLEISENTVKTQKKIAYTKLRKGLDASAFGVLMAL